ERLRNEIERQQGFRPLGTSIPELLAGRDWLFADELYHIDLSHLSAVVQMSSQLDDPTILRLARELCQYGQKLSPRFLGVTDPPFENLYVDYEIYLSILIGERVEEGLAHFRAKADNADPETIGTYPAAVLVNLLLRLKRPREALEVSRRFLAQQNEVRQACPSFVELCQQTGDYQALIEVSRQQGNPVNFLAGLLAAEAK
ncbi:MAG: hypothetical protein NZO58_13405, partial [Gemmataceae bacterium]|nr:hypothetical protein [Gemmataceae bacterium]